MRLSLNGWLMSIREILARVLRCRPEESTGASRRKKRWDGLPSMESKSTPLRLRPKASFNWESWGSLPWGMAMWSPMPVLPRRSRSSSTSMTLFRLSPSEPSVMVLASSSKVPRLLLACRSGMILSGGRISRIFIGPPPLLLQIGFHQDEGAILTPVQDAQTAIGHVSEHHQVFPPGLHHLQGIIHQQGRHLHPLAAHRRQGRKLLGLLCHCRRRPGAAVPFGPPLFIPEFLQLHGDLVHHQVDGRVHVVIFFFAFENPAIIVNGDVGQVAEFLQTQDHVGLHRFFQITVKLAQTVGDVVLQGLGGLYLPESDGYLHMLLLWDGLSPRRN